MGQALCGDVQNLFLHRLASPLAAGGVDRQTLANEISQGRYIKPKTDMLRVGFTSKNLHILQDGVACRYKLLPSGGRHISALILPGDLCDLDRLYFNRVDHGVVALSACTVATIERDTLLDICDRQPGVALALGRMGMIENARLAERNASLGRRTAVQHLAHLLCELLERFSAVGQVSDDRFRLPLTQEDLGDVLGLTAVHVNRVIQTLRRDGVIERSGQEVRVLDRERLQATAGFPPDYLHLHDDGQREGDRRPRLAATNSPVVSLRR